MHYSGLLVVCKPADIDACLQDLTQVAGVDVYASQAEAGRIVIVLETESVTAQESTFEEIQSLPRVVAAELVYHYFGEEEAAHIETGQLLDAHVASPAERKRDANGDRVD